MTARAASAFAIIVLAGGCAGRSPSATNSTYAHPVAHAAPALEFSIDSATLSALSANLERILQDRSLLSSLSPSHPRFYAFFRDLEAAQREFEISLLTPDASGQTLYDRLSAMTAHADSLLRALRARDRHIPRP